MITGRADPYISTLSLDLRVGNAGRLPRIRRWLAEELDDLGEAHLTDVLLVANELAANAHEHGDGLRGIRVVRRQDPCEVTVEVDDSNLRPLEAGSADRAVLAGGGCGLVLVDKAARKWGEHTPSGGGKTVWATVSCEECPCPPASMVRPD